MKLAKTVKLDNNEKVKALYGTVNFKELNSIFLRMETWITPLCDEDEAKLNLKRLPFKVRHHLNQVINEGVFRKKFISDVDIRLSGIKRGRSSFLSIESTFFINKNKFSFKSTEIKNEINIISESLKKAFLTKNDNFHFSSKKIKTQQIPSIALM